GNVKIRGILDLSPADDNISTYIGYNSAMNVDASNAFSLYNVFLGYNTGKNTTIGAANVYVGNQAGEIADTAWCNVYMGSSAGKMNNSNNNNVMIGAGAGRDSGGEYGNIYIGRDAGFINMGTRNVLVGIAAGKELEDGDFNVLLGPSAGRQLINGTENVAIGKNADFTTVGLTNAIAIGATATVDANNKIRMGNTNINVAETQVNWSITSDKRYKRNIKKTATGLDFILGLKPVSYQYNLEKIVKERHKTAAAARAKRSKSVENSELRPIPEDVTELALQQQKELQEAKEKSKVSYYGFIAQEVEAAAKKTAYKDFSGIVKPKENGGKYALRYAEFVVPLVDAVQTIKKEKDQEIAALKEENDELKERLAKVEALVATLLEDKTTKTQTTIITNASLGQNVPNPFNGITKLPYTIPENTQTAKIAIHNTLGQLIKIIPIQHFGTGAIELQTESLTNGQYSYSLEVDGQIVVTKWMNLMKK
ncbi:MAG: tail fiber domain-containing protein, partial [Saprospiraceae bacterium]